MKKQHVQQQKQQTGRFTGKQINTVSFSIMGILLCVMIICVIKLVSLRKDYARSEELYTELAAGYTSRNPDAGTDLTLTQTPADIDADATAGSIFVNGAKSPDFSDVHKYFQIFTENKVIRCKAVSYKAVSKYDSIFFTLDESPLSDNGEYPENAVFITLATCDTNREKRFTVTAVKIAEHELTDAE